jgi:outer membrane usher protein FimD/PapC
MLDTLAWERDYRGRNYQLGIFQGETSGYGFLTTRNFMGGGIKSSVLTRTDYNQSLGNVIEIFIESRSRIEIYSEGRLLSTRFYDVGNQILDTAGLPAGSYDIEIRIVDATGSVRSETRFFSKSSFLPPSDAGQYFLQAGMTGINQSGNWQGTEPAPMLRGGYSHRTGEATAISAGLSLTDKSAMIESVFFRQGRSFDFRASLAAESTGVFAHDFSLRYNNPLFNVMASYRNATGFIEGSQLEIARKLTSLNVDIPFSSGWLTLFARQAGGVNPGSSHGIRWRFMNNAFSGNGLRAGFELSRNNGDNLGLLYFSWRFGNNDAYYMASPQVSLGDNTNVLRGSLQAGWRRQDEFSTRSYSVRAISDTRRSLEASMAYEGPMMGSQLNLRMDNDDISAFGQLNNSLAWS